MDFVSQFVKNGLTDLTNPIVKFLYVCFFSQRYGSLPEIYHRKLSSQKIKVVCTLVKRAKCNAGALW